LDRLRTIIFLPPEAPSFRKSVKIADLTLFGAFFRIFFSISGGRPPRSRSFYCRHSAYGIPPLQRSTVGGWAVGAQMSAGTHEWRCAAARLAAPPPPALDDAVASAPALVPPCDAGEWICAPPGQQEAAAALPGGGGEGSGELLCSGRRDALSLAADAAASAPPSQQQTLQQQQPAAARLVSHNPTHPRLVTSATVAAALRLSVCLLHPTPLLRHPNPTGVVRAPRLRSAQGFAAPRGGSGDHSDGTATTLIYSGLLSPAPAMHFLTLESSGASWGGVGSAGRS
jgi:hypothetical protein